MLRVSGAEGPFADDETPEPDAWTPLHVVL
jgi:hypothetical protein